jgi:DNA-binding XRE family transcriptional regulator
MSAVVKTHLTRVTIGEKNPRRFVVPDNKAKGLLILLDDYRVCDDDEDTLSIEETFGYLYKDIGKPAMLLRGFRKRDELTQAQLAKKLATTQSAIAEMENGQRKIGLKMAKKIAAFFDIDYKEFI